MQGRGTVKPPTGVTFDSDFGENIDSPLTLALLRAMSSKGETRIISVSITKSNLKAAQAEEAITNFYNGGPAAGGTGFGGGADKVGLATNGKMSEDTPVLNAVVAKKTADGKPAFPAQIGSLVDTAECSVTMRNMLLAQNDLNAVVVVDGPATNVLQLMNLYGAKPQITAKVKVYLVDRWQVRIPNGAAEAGIRRNSILPRRRSCLPNGPRRSSPLARKWVSPCPTPEPASRKISPGRPAIPSWMPTKHSRRCRTMRRFPAWRPRSTRSIPMTAISNCRNPAPSRCSTMGERNSRRARAASIVI